MTRPGAPLPSLFGRAIEQMSSAPEADDRVFDAALAVLAERGTKAATMDDVAARSGVSRATLFRRFGGKDAVFEAALARALRGFLTEITATFLDVPDPVDRIEAAFVACLRFRRRFVAGKSDPAHGAALVSMLSAGDPSPLELGRRFVAARIVAGQSEGALPAADADIQADAIIRLTLSYLVLPSAVYDLDDVEVARSVARRAIAPIVTGIPR
ncbi:TetR/AcrR family transcriptional regulator [Rhodococcus phenolicus]|uniref:TetR/AcrR family transcriptional regulator n=1 Tax=Rhodococcus phenolicus TaxID=263849 RepID=UPI000831D469|nr:TetR/AcrR family transcriptional regulator [Rhodococcus phenolicus]